MGAAFIGGVARRAILEVRRDEVTRPVLKFTLRDVLREREKLRRAGWMNKFPHDRHLFGAGVDNDASYRYRAPGPNVNVPGQRAECLRDLRREVICGPGMCALEPRGDVY